MDLSYHNLPSVPKISHVKMKITCKILTPLEARKVKQEIQCYFYIFAHDFLSKTVM